MHRKIACVVIVACVLAPVAGFSQTQDAPATQPTAQLQTGDLDLTFTQRSPLSTPQEIARRLNVTPTSLGDDYDLSKLPYKAYVPTNYDPATPQGLFVYLGYKDSVATPPLWRPILEKYHLIFLTPVCHTGSFFGSSVPLWHTIGMALDGVYNFKKRYNIDNRRIYLMGMEHGYQAAFSTADVFAGFIIADDPDFYRTLSTKDSIYRSSFAAPPGDLMSIAKTRPYFVISEIDPHQLVWMKLTVAAMKFDDFDDVTMVSLNGSDELHYPNLKTDWFEQQALPFLEKPSASERTIVNSDLATTSPSANPSAAAAVSEPQHLLTLARLYMSNGMADQARKKLQEIINTYPEDPAAQTAKDLLSQMKQ
jgi:hypothetical protein